MRSINFLLTYLLTIHAYVSVWLIKKNFAPLASRLSSVLAGSSSTLALMINRFLSRITDTEKMVTTPSEPTYKQLQSLLDTGKLSRYTHSHEFCFEGCLWAKSHFSINAKWPIGNCIVVLSVLRSTCSWWVTTVVGKPGQLSLSFFRGR